MKASVIGMGLTAYDRYCHTNSLTDVVDLFTLTPIGVEAYGAGEPTADVQ